MDGHNQKFPDCLEQRKGESAQYRLNGLGSADPCWALQVNCTNGTDCRTCKAHHAVPTLQVCYADAANRYATIQSASTAVGTAMDARLPKGGCFLLVSVSALYRWHSREQSVRLRQEWRLSYCSLDHYFVFPEHLGVVILLPLNTKERVSSPHASKRVFQAPLHQLWYLSPGLH